MRAVLYTRVSLDRSGEGAAVARQLEDARELATRRGWTIVAERSDNDTSAAGSKKRPGFEAVLEDVESGRADAVVAWALDRLTRNRRDTVRLIEVCQAASATVALVRGSDIDMTTPSGRLVADVLASVARAEIETKSDRQKRANAQRAKSGSPMPGVRAFGYKRGNVQIEPAEAALVRQGYEQLLAGASLKSIARQWNEAGAQTPRGGTWTGTTVRRALLKPRYAGLRTHNGEIVARGAWEPVVTEDTYRATAHLLNDPARNTVADRSIKFLLTHIAECGRCDDGAKVATARTSRGARTYKCRERGNLSRAATPIDEYVEAITLARLGQPDVAALLAEGKADTVAQSRDEANSLRVQLDEAAAMYAAGEIRASQLATITRTLEERLASIEAELAAAGRGDALAGVAGSPDIAAAWEALDILQRRAIVRTLFARIVLEPVRRGARIFDPESVRIEWRRQS